MTKCFTNEERDEITILARKQVSNVSRAAVNSYLDRNGYVKVSGRGWQDRENRRIAIEQAIATWLAQD